MRKKTCKKAVLNCPVQKLFLTKLLWGHSAARTGGRWGGRGVWRKLWRNPYSCCEKAAICWERCSGNWWIFPV